MVKQVFAKALLILLLFVTCHSLGVRAAETPDDVQAGTSHSLAASASERSGGGSDYPDPLASFNERMFRFNLRLDEYVLRPAAGAYAWAVPDPARQSVGRFFHNLGVLPRLANDLFQMKVGRAGGEVARFGINTTLGVAGLFDVADGWFGLKERDNDFGLTLAHYGVGSGPYLVLPFLGPSTVRDAVGFGADGAMNPLNYLVPFYVSTAAEGGSYAAEAVNYRSLHLNLFEEADRYAIDLYGAVQDAYIESRQHQIAADTGEWAR